MVFSAAPAAAAPATAANPKPAVRLAALLTAALLALAATRGGGAPPAAVKHAGDIFDEAAVAADAEKAEEDESIVGTQLELSPWLMAPKRIDLDTSSKASGSADALTPDVCEGAALEAIRAQDALCAEAIDHHIAARNETFTYDLAEAGDQLVSEMCRGAATDKDGLKRDNDGVPEAQAVLVSGKMNTTSPDDPCGGGEGNGTALSSATKADGTPCSLDRGTASLTQVFDVAVVEMEKKRFDVKSYLQPTNAKERQHRLLCKLEAKQKESTGVTDSDLLRQIHRHQEIVETVLDAQQEGCSFALGIDSKELHKSKLRSCLRTFTDAQSVTMLQCRAKEADTRTLFEMRDFMCLHGDHISRDMFYCKLNGGSLLDIETMQKYQAFEASPGAAVVPRTTVEGMYALKKTLNQIGAVDADIKDAETKITQDAMPVPVPITSVVP